MLCHPTRRPLALLARLLFVAYATGDEVEPSTLEAGLSSVLWSDVMGQLQQLQSKVASMEAEHAAERSKLEKAVQRMQSEHATQEKKHAA